MFTPKGPEGLRALLGGKYYVSAQVEVGREYIRTIYSGEKTFYLYEHHLTVPIGSAYDNYMTESQFQKIPKELRAIAMLKCIIIPDDKKSAVKGLMEEYVWNKEERLSVQDESALVNERNEEASAELTKNYNGFHSTITVDRDKYAFFSVPYDRGFTAYVNGKMVKILESNGMMAVPLEKGKNEIVFLYRNYSLLIGIICSVFGLAIWGTYRKGDYIVMNGT